MGRTVKWTEKKIAEMEAAGYGQGKGSSYKPWIDRTSFSSRGLAQDKWSDKTNRPHALLSEAELLQFYCLDWSPEVIDIWEQKPLERKHTIAVAERLHIRHPFYPGTHVYAVMTVDFLVTVLRDKKPSFIAFNVKTDAEAEDEYSLLKLEIQREYFKDARIPHFLIFESDIPKTKATNIGWIYGGRLHKGEAEPAAGYYDDIKGRFADAVRQSDSDLPLNVFCAQFDKHLDVRPGTGLRAAKLLMLDKYLLPDLSQPKLEDAPLNTFVARGIYNMPRDIGKQ
jgi:hypothetical protein